MKRLSCLAAVVLTGLAWGDALAPGEDAAYWAQIKAYEDRFLHCRIVCEHGSYSYASWKAGDLKAAPSPAKRVLQVLSLDGDRKRADTHLALKNGHHEYKSLAFDGQEWTTWTFSDTDTYGGLRSEEGEEKDPWRFSEQEFRPFACALAYTERNEAGGETVAMSFTKEGDRIVARWEESPTHRYAFVFSPWQGMLRPENMKSILGASTEEPLIGYECRYYYNSDSEGEEKMRPCPVKIERIVEGHDIYSTILIHDVDFAPECDPTAFTFQGIRHHMWTIDEEGGVTHRYMNE